MEQTFIDMVRETMIFKFIGRVAKLIDLHEQKFGFIKADNMAD